MNVNSISERFLSSVHTTSPNSPKTAAGEVQKRTCDLSCRLFGGEPLCFPMRTSPIQYGRKNAHFFDTETGAQSSVRPRAALPVVFYFCFASYPKQSRGARPKSFAIIMLQKPITVLQSEIIDIPPRMLAIMLQSPITYL